MSQDAAVNDVKVLRVFGLGDYVEQWSRLEASKDRLWIGRLLDGDDYRNCWWFTFEGQEIRHPEAPIVAEIVCEELLARSLTAVWAAEGCVTFKGAEFLEWDVVGDFSRSGYVRVELQCGQAVFEIVRRQLAAHRIVQRPGLITETDELEEAA